MEIPGEREDLKRSFMMWGDIQLELHKIKLRYNWRDLQRRSIKEINDWELVKEEKNQLDLWMGNPGYSFLIQLLLSLATVVTSETFFLLVK